MSKKIAFYTFAALMLLSSCNSCDSWNITEDAGKKSVIVVMCDITRSLDTTSVTKVTEAAVKILEKSPDAEIFYYPIDSNLYVTPLLIKSSYANMRYSALSLQRKKDLEMLQKNIKEVYQKRNARASCILKGFQIAYNRFKQYEASNSEFKLLFLSDMLEHCTYGGKFIDLEKKNRYDASLEGLKAMPKPEFNLAELGVKLTFVITAHQQLPIDEGLHRDFWREACKAYGYSPEEFNKFNFGEGVPASF